jgi:hypothetical protein
MWYATSRTCISVYGFLGWCGPFFGECELSFGYMCVLGGPVGCYGPWSPRDLLVVLRSDALPACVLLGSKMVRRCVCGYAKSRRGAFGKFSVLLADSRTLGFAYLFVRFAYELGRVPFFRVPFGFGVKIGSRTGPQKGWAV